MLLLVLTALLTGTIVPLQTAANARMRFAANSLAATVLISFTVSLAVLLAASLLFNAPIIPGALHNSAQYHGGDGKAV